MDTYAVALKVSSREPAGTMRHSVYSMNTLASQDCVSHKPQISCKSHSLPTHFASMACVLQLEKREYRLLLYYDCALPNTDEPAGVRRVAALLNMLGEKS